MSNMTAKSDFAQKLLTDLRQRKERMAAAQNSSRQSSQTSRVTRGNSGQVSRGSGWQINALEPTGKTSRRSTTGTIRDSSNQIVLYEGSSQSSRQVRNLQMAIAFAFENSGNLTTIGGSTTNPLVNFFNRFGRKSPKTQTTTTFYNHRSSNQIPTVSHIHVNEISKGVHKLNQILTACSNGLNLDRNSIEIGRELLKGAINLEESLRMLVNLQDSSEYYTPGSQNKSRLKLLDEEEEEEEDEHEKRVEQWKVDRPRFSFDRTNSGHVKGANRQKQLALTYDHESISSLKVVPHKRSNSSVQDLSSSKPSKEKGRISNVVAKLMGLDEIPLKGDMRESNKQNQPLMKENTQPRKDLKMQTVELKPATNPVKKQHSNTNRVNDSTRKQAHVEDKDLQKKVQNSTMIKAEDRTRSANNHVARNQEMMPKRGDNSEEKKRFAEQKPQQIQKQNPIAREVNAPKSKRSAAMNVQKKLPRDKPIKPNMKDPPHSRTQDASVIVDNLQKTASNQESPKTECQSQNSSKNESEAQKDTEKGSNNPLLKEEKARKDVDRKVQRREMPKQMEVMVSRRNAASNQLKRSIKRPESMLKDLKQQMQRKNRGSKRIEEQSNSKAKERKEGINESVKGGEKLEGKDDEMIISNSSVANVFQDQNIQSKLIIKSDSIVSNGDVLNDFRMEEHPTLLKEEDDEELKKSDQSIETHEESTELDLLQQVHTLINRQEQQLTEPEKNLKETVIKSQLFLSTAEALFKLNIPLSFLHATYHQEHEPKGSKLVLDTSHEVLKGKARRHEVACHPYTKKAISTTKLRSLDDLIRQLCKDLEVLKSYGMSGSEEGDVAAGLHRMMRRDIYNEEPDVNCMWDLEWGRRVAVFCEMEDVVKDVERFVMNALVDEVVDLLLVVSVVV